MIFYLGAHHASWLAEVDVPLFVSRRSLYRRRKLPRASTRWALDSGGFTELNHHGHWTVSPQQYASEVHRFQEQIGKMDWAAPQDWMCEPSVRQKTGLTVNQHQELTVTNFIELTTIAPELPWIPVLQGWTLGEYMDHVEMYVQAGVDLRAEALVGVGSICRRQNTIRAGSILRWLFDEDINLHGFGFKVEGLRNNKHLLCSADSMAWSFNARKNPPLPECSHKSCSNCLRYALQWKEEHRL